MAVPRPEDLAEILGISIENMDCAGLKLHIDRVYRLAGPGKLSRDHRLLPRYDEIEPANGFFHLEPGPYYVKYREKIVIPNGYIALAIQRSSLIRMGATLYTAVWDPGYRGRGSGLLVVHNPNGIIIEKGAQIAQLVFFRMSGRTMNTYSGYYQDEE